jgi:hypothetical protein
MIFIQIAVTSFFIHLIAKKNMRDALTPSRIIAQVVAGKTPEMPIASHYVQVVSYWVTIVSGLAGVWSL